jgi:LysM repeat protein
VDIPGVLANTSPDQYCTYTAGAGDTLAIIAAKFDTTTGAITALNPDMTGVTPGSLWICPPMIGNAGGYNAARTLSGLAAAYNTDVTTLGTSNAATLGVLASGVAVTIEGVSTTTNNNSTLNGLLNIVLAAGVDATLSDVIDAVKDVSDLIAAAAMVAPIPPPSPASNDTAITPGFTDAVFQITVNVVAARDPRWVDPDFVDVPSVRRVSYSVPPQPDQTGGDGQAAYTLTQFATLMQASLPGLSVATGEPAAQGEDPESANTIWGVNFGNGAGPKITYDFQGAQTQYFALPPLSTALVGGTVPIKPYVPGQGLGTTAVNQTFQGVDLDVWMNTFLSACDLMLTPAYAVPAYAIDPVDTVTIVSTKESLAQRISDRIAYVLQVPAEGSLDDARAAMYQALLSQLSSAFTVDTLMQVPVTVSSAYTDPLVAPRLSGKIHLSEEGGGGQSVPSAFSFSTAKVALTQPGATATFLFSVKAPAQFKVANLDLQYVVTELELPDPKTTIGEYEGSSWLKFILPLESASSDIGDVSIPVPLRSYPSPVTLVSQTATQSVPVPQSATDLLGWDFDFVYRHDDAEQDTPLVAATFNGVTDPLAMLGGTNGLDLNAVFAALAQFISSWPLLKDDLATLTSLAPGTTNATALAAVRTFETLMVNVADAWAQSPMALGLALEMQTFTYQMQKGQTDDTNPTLTTLTLTSIDTGTGQPAPNPFALWPEVYAVVNGAEEQLTPAGSPTATQAVYDYPAGIPAATDLAQRFAYAWPDGVIGPQGENGFASDAGADQTFQFDGVNIFSQQSGIAGVAITRNLSLVEGTPTNTAFVYRTPLVNFTSSAIPSVFAGTPIALSGAPMPVGQALGTFLETLFTSHNQWQPTDTLTIRFAAAYSYALASTPGGNGGALQTLDTLVPITLVPSYDFNPSTDWNWNDENSFVSRIQAVVDAWQAANNPVETNGSYLFDLTVIASGGQLQPLVQATSLQYALEA